jgi:hypothetical protein
MLEAEIIEMEKENETLKAKVEEFEKVESERKYRHYIDNIFGSTILLVILAVVYFGALELGKNIIAHWAYNGLLSSTPPWELATLVLIYLMLVFIGIVKGMTEILDLYKDQIEWIRANVPSMVCGAVQGAWEAHKKNVTRMMKEEIEKRENEKAE